MPAKTKKGKKVVEEEVPEPPKEIIAPPPTASEWMSLLDCDDGTAFISGIVDEVLERGEEIVGDLQTQDASIPLAVSMALNDATNILKYLNVQCDPGEVDADNSPLWNPEKEHTPAAIDSYARGIVQVRRKLVSPGPGLGFELDGVGSVQRAFSIASGTSRGTRRSRMTARTARSRLSRSGSALSITSHDSGDRAAGGRRPVRNKAPAPAPSTWRHPLVDLRGEARSEEEAVMQAKFEAIKARQHAEKEEQKALQQLQNEMRGKQYTFDSNGNVIVVKPVEPEKLPATTVNLRSAIKLTEEEIAERERLKKYGKRAVTRTAPKEPEEMAPPRKKESKPEVFTEFVPWQPAAVDVIPVSEGVTLREGSKVKAGPPQPEDPMRMTREKFQTMTGDSLARGTLGGGTTRDIESSINQPEIAEATIESQIQEEPAKEPLKKASVVVPKPNLGAGGDKSPLPQRPTPRQKLSARGPAGKAMRERPFVHSASPHVLQPTRDNQTGSFNASMTSTIESQGGTKPKYSFKANQESSINAPNRKLVNEMLS